MASIKELKKDINFLTSELIAQAYLNRFFFKKMNDEELTQLVSDALDFRTEFVAQANHPDGKDNPKLVRNYYRELRINMIDQFGQILEAVNSKMEESERT